jgi:hypothetical protein
MFYNAILNLKGDFLSKLGEKSTGFYDPVLLYMLALRRIWSYANEFKPLKNASEPYPAPTG